MRHYDKRSVETQVHTSTSCDICKQDMKSNNDEYYITSQHRDWGNDSCDSVKYIRDLCSFECFMLAVRNEIKSNDYHSFTINDMSLDFWTNMLKLKFPEDYI